MFTQCSNCHTVFQLSAQVLRAAGGQVRCGRCGEIFSALARLAEDANSFDNGESAYELEERADSILESLVAEQVAQANPDSSDEEDFGGSEIARLQVMGFSEEDLIDEAPEEPADNEPEDYADASMEYTLPPGELDRIFVESRAGLAPPFPLDYEAAPTSAAAEPASTDLELPEEADMTATEAAHVDDEGPLPDIQVIADNRSTDAARRPAPPLSEFGSYDLQDQPARPAGSVAPWVSAAILSALLLAGQVVNRNREALTAHGPLAPMLRQVYSSIGAPLLSAPNLAVYQLRQWGVTGDTAPGVPAAGVPAPSAPATDATLRVRASILNVSAMLQPFPLLRVTLANRYGSALGVRDFEPGEYMSKPIVRELSPGETVDAILNIIDPGKDAEGFEIDVCLRGADKKIICANDAAQPRSKP